MQPPGTPRGCDATAPQALVEADERVAEAPARPIRVLVVDEQELFRRGLVLVLSGDPEVELVGEAADGDAALELVTRWAPDVVLLDARLPGMSDIRDAVKSAAPEASVVMLGSVDSAPHGHPVGCEASSYLLKDAAVDEVAKVVRQVAGRVATR